MKDKRISVKLGGASGQGVNSIGFLLAKALNVSGFKIFAYREYPSLIKGGFASYQVDFSSKEINSSTKLCNILLIFSQESLNNYLPSLKENGILLYEDKDIIVTQEQEEYIKQKNISKVYLDSKAVAKEAGGTDIMSNVVMLGFLWKILDLDIDVLEEIVLEHFRRKNIDLEAEKKALLGGYNSPTFRPELSQKIEVPKKGIVIQSRYVLMGNDAISLGAIKAGVRAYYAYPMTPATHLLKYFGENAQETGMIVKQAESEITAIHMAMGSMYMGTRALVGTSGGGFDLMIETISCAGMTETPLVVFISQRAGAGTGVPTWTGATDLTSAVHSGHGEYPKCVIATSDALSSYTLIQHAFNIADIYQLPVILLGEKQISESLFSVQNFPKDIPIERNLMDGKFRYEITDNGISPRWVPSKGKEPYLSNSDEHNKEGVSTENQNEIVEMTEKRMRKMQLLKEQLPQPKYFGKNNAEILFVGWGSLKNAVLDAMDLDNNIAYLHYEYMYPLKTELLEQLVSKRANKRTVLIENNQTGQLGRLIKEGTGYEFNEKLLKYNSQPFFVEDILDFLHT